MTQVVGWGTIFTLVWLAYQGELTFLRVVLVIIVATFLQFQVTRFKNWRRRGTPLEEAHKRAEALSAAVTRLEEQLQETRDELEAAHAVYGRAAHPLLKPGHAQIKITTVTTLRNLLLMHHNARQTDPTYTTSRTAAQTNDTIASLNGYLEKRG